MKSAIGILAVCFAVAWADPASAAPKVSLVPTGRTVGGPVDITINAGTTETVVNNPAPQGAILNACVTLANTGNGAVNLNLVNGNGATTTQVPVRETSVACRAAITSVTIACLATGSGICSVSWRLDSVPSP